MLPAFRLGFIVSPPSLSAAVHKAKHVTDWHTAELVQAALARFIDNGDFARHVRKVGKVYQARHEAILRILNRDFADCLMGIPSAAGLHIAAQSTGASVEQTGSVVRRALAEGVAVHCMSQFAIDVTERAGIVVGYGAIATGDIEEGLRRLRTCFEA
jgi:GntR family transcriptional regulator/MocR family aminotransferase